MSKVPYGTNRPLLWPCILPIRIVPLFLQLRREWPRFGGVSQPEPDQVPLLCSTVFEPFPTMNNAKIVPELHITALLVQHQGMPLSSEVHCVQCLCLSLRQRRDARRAR